MPAPDRDSLAAQWRRAGQISAVGLEMVIAVVGGALLGSWLDDHWRARPCGLLAGLAIGIGAAAVAVLRVARQLRPRPKPLRPPPPDNT